MRFDGWDVSGMARQAGEEAGSESDQPDLVTGWDL